MITITILIEEIADGDVSVKINGTAKDNIATQLESAYADALMEDSKHSVNKLAEMQGVIGVEVKDPFKPENQ